MASVLTGKRQTLSQFFNNAYLELEKGLNLKADGLTLAQAYDLTSITLTELKRLDRLRHNLALEPDPEKDF